jgi:hypothetical protein
VRGRGAQARNGKAPVVTAVAAGGHGSAFLTRAADEFPESCTPQLQERCGIPRTGSHAQAMQMRGGRVA